MLKYYSKGAYSHVPERGADTAATSRVCAGGGAMRHTAARIKVYPGGPGQVQRTPGLCTQSGDVKLNKHNDVANEANSSDTRQLDGFLREDLGRRVEKSDDHAEDGEDAADDGAGALCIVSRQ